MKNYRQFRPEEIVKFLGKRIKTEEKFYGDKVTTEKFFTIVFIGLNGVLLRGSDKKNYHVAYDALLIYYFFVDGAKCGVEI